MARILAYTSPARGHLYPIVPILQELRGRGHEIALRTLTSQVELASGLGFDASSIDPAIEHIEHHDYLARSPIGAEKLAVRVFCERAPHDARDLRGAVVASDPDLVLVDVNAWGALAAAEAWGGPWAAFCPYPLPLPSRDAPPFGPGLPPAHGPLGRVRDALLRPIVVGSLDRIIRPKVNEVLQRIGVRPLSSAMEMYAVPPLLLYLTAEPFEYHRSDWPPNVRLVGACDWDQPSDPPGWLDDIAEPIVLVTTSSEFQDDGRLVRCALEAFAGRDVHVVATVPSMDLAKFGAPSNAHVLPFTPHAPVLARAACAITHGGMGATQKALAHGVPVCAVPFGRDQFEVARRVEVVGAGARLPAKRLRPDLLRERVRRAMRLRDGARRVPRATGLPAGPGPPPTSWRRSWAQMSCAGSAGRRPRVVRTPALEEPQLLAEEIHAFFRPLQTAFDCCVGRDRPGGRADQPIFRVPAGATTAKPRPEAKGSYTVRVVRRAGLEPATRCLEAIRAGTLC